MVAADLCSAGCAEQMNFFFITEVFKQSSPAFLFLLQFMFGLGLTFFAARITALLPDMRNIWPFLTQFWFYGSGVFFSYERFINHPKLRGLPCILETPNEFEGYKREKMGPAGGQRHGVFRIDEFFERQIGCLPEDMTTEKWLSVPEYALAEAVNGEMFRDDLGLVEDQRAILGNMPEDMRKKRLAGHLLMMAQSGQYNYTRCLKHGEPGAAMLAAGEFVKHAVAAVFLLNHRYMPYYKWSFRALRELPDGDVFADTLEWILCAGGPETAEEKYYRIEDIAARVIDMLQGRT